MQSFTCEKCKGTWSFDDIMPLVLQYGFINLVSFDDELIAFSCPGNECNSLITHRIKSGLSKQFHTRLADELDPTGYESSNAEFKYLSSLPFSPKKQDVLTNFEVLEEEWSLWDYQQGLTPERGDLYNDFYCSFNEQCLLSYGDRIRIWWYRKKDINKLFDIEQASQFRIFPRYMRHSSLLERINTFYSKQFLQEDAPADPKIDSSSAIIDSWSKGEIERQYTFLELLTPPRDVFHEFSERDSKVISYHSESDSIWKKFHQPYIQEQLSSQSELFIRDYLQLYSNTNFCLSRVEKLVSRYRSQVSEGLKSRRKKEVRQKQTLTGLVSNIEKEAPVFNHIISEDNNMLRLILKLNRRARRKKNFSSILLTGETGTGKTFFAEAIHNASGRPGKFKEANVANLSENLIDSALFGHKKGAFSGAIADRAGSFKAADNGTLFLDEIGELPLNLQAKLLTVTQNGSFTPLGSDTLVKVNVLIVYATNKDLEKAVKEGTFREDLYYRIKRSPFHIPPLRKRKNDICLLANYFIKKHATDSEDMKLAATRISEAAQKQLVAYKWPGNIRQLENMIEDIIGPLEELDDYSAISLEEVVEWLSENTISENDRIEIGDSSAPPSQTNSDFDNIPDVPPAPGKRKMPDKKGIEQLLSYFLAKKGNAYGVRKKTADHIGVTARHLYGVIDELGIKFP